MLNDQTQKDMETPKVIAKSFESVGAYEAYLANGTTQAAFVARKSSEVTGADGMEFCGTPTYQHANDLLLYGDRELAAQIEKSGLAKTRARLHANAQTIKTEASVVGFMPHVPNFVAGVPLTMIQATRTERRRKAVSIVYDVTAHCGISKEEMIETASRVLSAVMMIEAAGERVNLYAAAAVTGHGAKVAALVRVKSCDKKLDPVRCAYPLVNPSFLRRHFFRFIENENGVPSGYVNGYGHALPSPRKDLEEIIDAARLGIKDAVLLNFYEARYLTIEGIIETIKKNGH